MTEETVHGTLIAKKDGIYTVYVFQNDSGDYRMCTKLPNWGIEYNLNIGDKGFITLQSFLAGEKIFDQQTGKEKIVKRTNVYFKEFIKDNKHSEKIIL